MFLSGKHGGKEMGSTL